jgi:hypothetical protein
MCSPKTNFTALQINSRSISVSGGRKITQTKRKHISLQLRVSKNLFRASKFATLASVVSGGSNSQSNNHSITRFIPHRFVWLLETWNFSVVAAGAEEFCVVFPACTVR